VTYRGQGEGQAIAMSGPLHDTHPNDRRVLHFAGLAALQRMEELAAPTISTVHLSERERECLTWVAAGKNDWEIGMILGVSNKTVNCHVERAKHKLGAVTRMQAVVKAYHQRLIEL
jgi:DNA-binding CsgD family transcriptional regulator